jgi:hypothetical protein
LGRCPSTSHRPWSSLGPAFARPFAYWNTSIILWYAGYLFVGVNSSMLMYFVCRFIAQRYVRKCHPKVFVKYNYLVSAVASRPIVSRNVFLCIAYIKINRFIVLFPPHLWRPVVKQCIFSQVISLNESETKFSATRVPPYSRSTITTIVFIATFKNVVLLRSTQENLCPICSTNEPPSRSLGAF